MVVAGKYARIIYFDMQWSTMLWDIPYSTNNNVIPGIFVYMGHSSRPL
jgi:hypothetical protein